MTLLCCLSLLPFLSQVCKHFLQAIEKGIYGWFWECPSGGDKCIYRHALPPGFVLKKMQKEQESLQPQDTITLEELVEKEVSGGWKPAWWYPSSFKRLTCVMGIYLWVTICLKNCGRCLLSVLLGGFKVA